MMIIDYFTSNNYYCFTYDACGNDLSEGYCVNGLPEGVKDLDFALNHTKDIKEYVGLPVYLIGHSYGAYSVLNVLNYHQEVKGVVAFAEFNDSMDLIEYYGSRVLNNSSKILIPYFKLYEKIKFGNKYTNISGISGIEKSNAKILIVHSMDDTVVPVTAGFSDFKEKFEENDRINFITYNNRGHGYLFYTDNSSKYREELNKLYVKYVEENNKKFNAEVKNEFMEKYLDKKKCFELDIDLFNEILDVFH